MDTLKKQLIDLLTQDSDVQTAILAIIPPPVSVETSHKIEALQATIKENQQMIETLKKLLGIKTSDNENLASSLDDLKTALQSKDNEISALTTAIDKEKTQTAYYEQLFKDELSAYRAYEALSDKTQKSLSGIFKDDSMSGFIACGVQERNIENLWDYIRNEDMEDKNDDLPKLKTLFEFLFSRYLIAYPIYQQQPVEKGDTFDAQSHIKHSRSKNVSGEIQAISLRGWVNKKTRQIKKQSVVII